MPIQLPDKEKEEVVPALADQDLKLLSPEERIKALAAQNDNLRAVVRQMRKDMEDLSSQPVTRPSSVTVQSKEGESGTSVPLTKGNHIYGPF